MFNVLTENLTVNSIVEYIKGHVQPVNIEYVDSEIMNQLSYEVLNKKLTDKGFVYSGSIGECIKETIMLLNQKLS